jgi:hypothetical protein
MVIQMESTLLRNMGLEKLDIGIVLVAMIVIILCLLTVMIILLVRFSNLSTRYQAFMQGSTARSLESDIVRLYEESKYVKLATEKNRKDVTTLFDKVSRAFQKVGLVKYDAFHQMGGKLSFSLAMLDEGNNGFVLNSVHSVEGCYTYTKEIVSGTSVVHLGDEEKQALDMACARK